MTEPKEADDLLERAKRWAMNTGWDGNPNSVPMRLIAENAVLREKLAKARDALLRDAGALIQAFAREGYLSNKIIYCDTDRVISMRKTLNQIDTLTGGDNA